MRVTKNELKKQRAAVGVAKTQAEAGEAEGREGGCRVGSADWLHLPLSVAWLVAHEFTLEFAGASCVTF